MNMRAKLDQITKDLETAENVVSSCKDRYDDIFRPIGLELHEIASSSGFESMSVAASGVFVRYGYSCRGSYGSEDFHIPWSILDAKDPVEAAKLFRAERLAARKRAEIEEKQTQLARLQSELNGINETIL
jgi:hypothetical protein